MSKPKGEKTTLVLHYFILDENKNPVKSTIGEYTKWALQYATDELARRVGYSEGKDIDSKRGVVISTVFLGVNHAFNNSGPPVLFETLVRFSDGGESMTRYHTWDEAVQGHRSRVKIHLGIDWWPDSHKGEPKKPPKDIHSKYLHTPE